MDASKAEITRIKNELAPVEERLQELNAMYDQVTMLERKISKNHIYTWCLFQDLAQEGANV